MQKDANRIRIIAWGVLSAVAGSHGARQSVAADVYWFGTQATCTGTTDVGSFFHDDNWINFAHPEAPDTSVFGSGFDADPPDNPHIIFFGDTCLKQGICNETIVLGGTAITENLAIQSGDWTFDFNTLSDGCAGPPGQTTGNYTVTLNTWVGMTIQPSGAPGFATLTLAGPGVLDTNNLFVGAGDAPAAGHGIVIVRDGATLRCGGGVVAAIPGSSGEVHVIGPGSALVCTDNVAVGNNGPGMVEISDGGSLDVDGFDIDIANGGLGASISIGAGSSLVAANVFIAPTGLLGGTGTANTNVFNQGGSIGPGFSAGVLTINGNYTQLANGTLEIELGGTNTGEFDQLIVNGVASLDGTLNITLIDGFIPQAGDQFPVINYSSQNGAFGQINAPNGVVFQPTFGSNGLSLEATSVAAIPAVSTWGLTAMALLMLTIGTFVIRRERTGALVACP